MRTGCKSFFHAFTAPPKSGNDLFQMRRTRFVARLEEQKQLLIEITDAQRLTSSDCFASR
jgi:hypothetical protein